MFTLLIFLCSLFIISNSSYSSDFIVWDEYLLGFCINEIELEDDNIWCATTSGVILFNKKDFTFTQYTKENGLTDNLVYSVSIDHNGKKWFGSEYGVSSYDGKEWQSFTEELNIYELNGTKKAFKIAVDQDNVKWVVAQHGVVSYNDTVWTVWRHSGVYNNVFVDNNNIKYFIGGHIKTVYDGEKWTDYLYVDDKIYFISVAVDKNQIQWYGGVDGFRSFDGKEWVTYNEKNGYEDLTVISIKIDNNNIKWFGTGFGLYSYDEREIISWNNNYHFAPAIDDIEIDDNGYIWAACRNWIWKGALVRYRLNSLSVENEHVIPTPTIKHIAPNPFNTSTTISFTLLSSGLTSLVIYNITGQKVCELISDTMSVGKHSVTWNGRNESGALVSSGIYIIRLTKGKYSTSRLLTFVK